MRRARRRAPRPRAGGPSRRCVRKGICRPSNDHYCPRMTIQLKSARVERWPVAGEFVISRGAKAHVDVVVAEIEGEGAVGRGEGTHIYYLGEDAARCREIGRANVRNPVLN